MQASGPKGGRPLPRHFVGGVNYQELLGNAVLQGGVAMKLPARPDNFVSRVGRKNQDGGKLPWGEPDKSSDDSPLIKVVQDILHGAIMKSPVPPASRLGNLGEKKEKPLQLRNSTQHSPQFPL